MQNTRFTQDRVGAIVPELQKLGLPVRQTGACFFVDAGVGSFTIETEAEYEWFMRGFRVANIVAKVAR